MRMDMSDNQLPLPKKQQGINSIEIGMEIVKVLAKRGRPMALGDIAAATRMSPAKAHRYLVSLIRTGMVQQYSHSGKYELGAYALEFSLTCLAKLEALRIESSVLKTLALEVEESVFTAAWSADGPMVIDWQPPNRPIAASTQIGAVFSVLMSSTGRVYGAYLPTSITRPLVERELHELANKDDGYGPRSMDEVEDIFAEVRARGLGRGIGIRWPSINSFSAPVFDYRGKIVNVVTVFGNKETFDADWAGRIARELQATTVRLSIQRGYQLASSGLT